MMTMESLDRPIEVLLVEDNHGDQLLMREACATAAGRINMRVASDGEEALRILRPGAGRDGHVAPDVILLDLNLPGIDGRDVLQAIKREPPISRVPVIALIGSAAEIDVLHDLEADSYIVKPSGFDQLQQIVAAIESYRPSVVARPNGVKLGKSGAC